MIGLFAFLGPFRHFRRQDIQMSIPIEVTDIQSLTMDHVTFQQITARQSCWIGWVSLAIVKFERAPPVPRCDDDFPELPRLKLPALNPPAYSADLNRFELC